MGTKKTLFLLLLPVMMFFLIALTAVSTVYQTISAGGGGRADAESILYLPEPLTFEIVDAAMSCEKTYGIPTSVILAVLYERGHGLMEGGKGVLAFEAKNYFQMKGTGTRGSKHYQNFTEVYEQEVDENGQLIYEKTRLLNGRYRKYRNYAESMDDFCKLITKKKYKQHTKKAKDSIAYIKALRSGGYFFSDEEMESCIKVLQEYDLAVFDDGGYQEGDGVATGIFVWPTVSDSVITSYFGFRNTQISGASTYHQGIDIGVYGNVSGAPIYAADGGTVTYAGYLNSAAGYAIYLDHGGGVKTSYMHLRSDGVLVRKGQNVTRGQHIGKMGSTGVSSGTHLDFRIYIHGRAVDPLQYVRRNSS